MSVRCDEGWARLMLKGGRAGRNHEVEDSAVLPSERGMHREHTFDEAAPVGGMRAGADLAHEDGVTDFVFGTVVRGFNAFDTDEGPEGLTAFEQLHGG